MKSLVDFLIRKLRDWVLRSVADDYEELERISQEVFACASERSLSVNRILSALEALISEGYVQSYLLSAGPPGPAQPVKYDAKSGRRTVVLRHAKGQAASPET